ncbi:MAG TPA: EutN/CcmL family microcompartment protein [bacterium]|nr:EutN/CcmL family microcompartment protein [bacterium]
MNIATVIGSLWATQKHHSFNGMKFCVIQPLDQNRRPVGSPIIAVDPDNRCGRGETVFYVDGGDAATVKENHSMPSDATIVGIIDSMSTDSGS